MLLINGFSLFLRENKKKRELKACVKHRGRWWQVLAILLKSLGAQPCATALDWAAIWHHLRQPQVPPTVSRASGYAVFQT